jgi:hypothetical protein
MKAFLFLIFVTSVAAQFYLMEYINQNCAGSPPAILGIQSFSGCYSSSADNASSSFQNGVLTIYNTTNCQGSGEVAIGSTCTAYQNYSYMIASQLAAGEYFAEISYGINDTTCSGSIVPSTAALPVIGVYITMNVCFSNATANSSLYYYGINNSAVVVELYSEVGCMNGTLEFAFPFPVGCYNSTQNGTIVGHTTLSIVTVTASTGNSVTGSSVTESPASFGNNLALSWILFIFLFCGLLNSL